MKSKNGGIDRRAFVAGGVGLLGLTSGAFGQVNSSIQSSAYTDPNFEGGPVAGPFRPNWESLKAYRCPDWFRDAKFGIWAHWSPQ